MRQLTSRAAIGQSRKHSMFEAITNVCLGLGINLLLNFTVFPWFGWEISLQQNLLLGAIYTVVSIIRSYLLRRAFNRIHELRRELEDVEYGLGI